jgi:ribonuclease Y
MTTNLLLILSGALGVGLGLAVGVKMGSQVLRERLRAARAEASSALKAAKGEAAVIRSSSENKAREGALALQEEGDTKFEKDLKALASKEERVQSRLDASQARRDALDDRKEDLREREAEVKSNRDRASGLRSATAKARENLRSELEGLAETTGDTVVESLRVEWIEEAEAAAAQQIRSVEQGAGDAAHGREANRLMSVAVSRYQNHFLTERNISNIPLEGKVIDLLVADDNRILDALALGANTKLNLHDSGDGLRLEGLDGVGREVARRGLKALGRKPKAIEAAKGDPEIWVGTIRSRLDDEIERLGKKAFKVLKVPAADAEIVKLVGALNYRTSYTQNQWLHAVEAAFLAGMMAEELGLDIGMARRATLMHDIGKALTHEIEGSHAVIGADIARRLGEDEIIANAIGSHHADEPANSAYAFLVAAADAMSGARPGARREQSEGFSTRLEDLERLGSAYKGVSHCAAVHGGRELRVYVDNGKVSDLEAVEMSSEMAAQISEELTFPGQVKVTVIRASESVAVAS